MRLKSCEGLEQALACRVGFVVRRHGREISWFYI